MTVNTTPPIAGPYVADGLNNDYPYSFRVADISHLVVEVTVGDDVVLHTDGFTATGVGGLNGGVVTFAGISAGASVRILRNVPYSQPTRIGDQGAFYPQTHEEALDNLAMQIQQLANGGLGTAAGDAATAAQASAVAAAASAIEAAASAVGVSTYALLAQLYANAPENQVVETGPNRYSAFHWSEKAKAFAGGGAYGDVFGPGIAVDGHAVLFSGTTGKLIKTAGFAPANAVHDHDTVYYTKTLVDSMLAALAASTVPTSGIGVSVQAFSSQLLALAGVTNTAFGRALLALADAAALRTAASAAARSQTEEMKEIFIRAISAETLDDLFAYMTHAGTLTSLRMKIRSGTSVGVRLRKAGANWDGAVRTVTTTLTNFNASLPLTWNVGDSIGATFSSLTGSPVDLSIILGYTRTYG